MYIYSYFYLNKTTNNTKPFGKNNIEVFQKINLITYIYIYAYAEHPRRIYIYIARPLLLLSKIVIQISMRKGTRRQQRMLAWRRRKRKKKNQVSPIFLFIFHFISPSCCRILPLLFMISSYFLFPPFSLKNTILSSTPTQQGACSQDQAAPW